MPEMTARNKNRNKGRNQRPRPNNGGGLFDDDRFFA